MKIAFISTSINETNGWGRITKSLAFELRKYVNLYIYLPKNENIDKIKGVNIKKILPPILKRNIYALKNIIYHIHTIINIIINDYDIVHCLFHYYPYIFDCIIASKIRKKNVIIGAQGTYGVLPLTKKFLRFFLNVCYKNSRIIHTASNFTKNEMLKFLDIKNILKFPINGVNIKLFHPIKQTIKLPKEYESNPTILSVGALKYRKGQDILIKAFNIIKKKIENAKLLIIGSGNFENKLKKLISKYNINDIEFLGTISGNALVKYYNMCDLFILTPRFHNYNFEGFGLVYLEAGACGKPVIGTNSGGVSEVIKHGETGFIVEENDYNKVAEYAIQILSNKELKDKLSKSGLLNARFYAWSNICKRLLKLYYRILEL
ncbi:MAG: glycosyltransferase family 4 protein [Candidatus Helarchaeota archaeon]